MWSIIFGIILIYAGGWELVWAEPGNIFSYGKDFYFGNDGIVINVNKEFYGLKISNRFFDSFVLSWLSLGGGLAAIFGSFSSNKENNKSES